MRQRRGLLRARGGFTLLEALMAMLLSAVILGAVYDLFAQLVVTRRSAAVRNDVTTAAAQIAATIRADVEAGDATTFATDNWAAVNALVGTVAGAEADTLVALYGIGPQVRASARGCKGAGAGTSCMRLQSGATVAQYVRPNDIIVVGSPSTGARLYQVTRVRYAASDTVGEDGPPDTFSGTNAAAGTTTIDTVITATYRNTAGVVTATVAGSCAYSYDVTGNTCTETRATNTVTSYTSGDAVVPTGSGPRLAPYAEVEGTEVTALFGYPAPSTVYTPLSGAHGVPLVVAQRLGVARYYVDHTRPTPTLVRQADVRAGGVWGTAVPIAANVTRFRVDVQHRALPTLQRGVGVTGAGLAVGGANCPTGGAAVAFTPGAKPWTCSVSYATIALVRARFALRDDHALAARGQVAQITDGAVTIATPGIAHGGVLPP